MTDTQQDKKPGNGADSGTEPTPATDAPATDAPAAEAAAPSAEAAAPEPSELDKAKADTARLKDQLLRTAADYENFRKRARREVEDARARGRDETLAEMLPVFDNLARAAEAAATAPDAAAIVSGLQLVLGQIDGALGRVGVTPIVAKGQPFDPTKHDAIQQVESADVPPGTVVEEVQRGYVNGERLVRAALVVVARAPSPAAEPAGGAAPSEPGEEPA